MIKEKTLVLAYQWEHFCDFEVFHCYIC